MTRLLAVAALALLAVLPWGTSTGDGPPVHVSRLPAVPPWTPVGDLPAGTVFQTSVGPCMIVAPLHDPEPPYVYYRTRQFPRPFDWYPPGVSYYDPPLTMAVAVGVGVLAVAALADATPDVWAVSLGSGLLFKIPAALEVRPVAGVRVVVQVGAEE